MPYKTYYRSVATAIVFVLVITLAATMSAVSADGDDDQLVVPEKTQLNYPNLSPHLNHLADGYSSGHMSQQQAAGEAPIHSGGSVAVTIYLDSYVSDIVTFLEDNGGDVRNVGSDYIEAYVPVGLLGLLSQQPGVTRVWEIIPPQPAYGNVTSQAVSLHQADSWHDAGLRGQGVKVGVIDVGFRGYSSLMGVELPANVVARCYTDVSVYTNDLADCEALDPPSPSTPAQCIDFVQPTDTTGVHGTAVAEAVIDIAPDATLYIANPLSRGDLQETATWMAGQGVTVINYSVGWTFDGPGDGTSPFSDSPLNAVDQAVDRGITWVTSAGNSAEDTWFGGYSNNDGDGFISFDPSGAEINSIALLECRRYSFQLRWEDSWGGASTDLDIYLWDRSTGDILDIPAGWGYVGSIAEQSGASDDYPFEFFSLRSPINSRNVGVIIFHRSGPEPEWVHLELRSGPGGLGHSTGAGSIGNPAESANPGLLAVGAAPFYDTDTIESYSSRGPTPDGRTKPDIVGVDCGASVSYEVRTRSWDNDQQCWFSGTSQASPHVAGMATLIKQQNPGLTPQQVASYLKNNAQDRGLTGPDNIWGSGLAQMPALSPSESCLETLTGDGVTTGHWAAGCQSGVTDRGFARYYSFTLEEDSEVTIDLSSDVDTYMYLRSGDVLAGTFVAENDDHEGSQRVSRISETLGAGSYTIEATTFTAGETGSFTLTVSGLGGTATEPTDPDPGETDSCGETLSGDGTVTGTWAAGCESEARTGSYARYYTFTVGQESDVTITLARTSGGADTYLNLWSGSSRTGSPLDDDDDTPDTSRSEITRNLAAGDYTVEATTFDFWGDGQLHADGLGPGRRDLRRSPRTRIRGRRTAAERPSAETGPAVGHGPRVVSRR